MRTEPEDEGAMSVRTTAEPMQGGPGQRAGRSLAITGVITIVVLAQAGLVLAPSQVDSRPLLVLALRPTPAFLVLVAEVVPPAAAVLVAALGRTLVDVAYFAVARHGALPVLQRFGIGRGLTRGIDRPTATRGLLTLLFFWSSTPVIAALGLGRTRPRVFIAVTGLGNLTTSAAFVSLGRRFADQVAPVTAWLSAHGTALTVALAALVLGSAATTMVRARRRTLPAGAAESVR